MTQNLGFEIYDSKGRFKMPTPSQVEALDPQTQANFAAVREADTELQQATEARIVAENGVLAALAERDAAEKALRRVRPKIDPVQNAKDHIASERATR
jgi:hypothetical protein